MHSAGSEWVAVSWRSLFLWCFLKLHFLKHWIFLNSEIHWSVVFYKVMDIQDGILLLLTLLFLNFRWTCGWWGHNNNYHYKNLHYQCSIPLVSGHPTNCFYRYPPKDTTGGYQINNPEILCWKFLNWEDTATRSFIHHI